jgi:hypothetical protein
VTAEIETTHPGTVTLEISNDDRVVARVTQPVSAGHSMLRAVGLIRDKWYEVRVKLAGASGVTASDVLPVHGARALTVRLVRTLLGRYQGRFEDSPGSYRLGRDCRRYSRWRVDCQIDATSGSGTTRYGPVGVASVTLGRTGIVLRRNYRWGRRGFRKHPRFDMFYGVRRLSPDYRGRWLD